MQAIILAAGVGERLGAAAGGRPKCLLEMDGRTLLSRHIEFLRSYGIADVNVVTGYQEAMVIAELEKLRCGASLFHNPDYRAGSVVSLHAARAVLDSDEPVLLMDADVLYHPSILGALAGTRHANCLLIDRNFEAGDEPVKVCVDEGQIVEFRKRVAPGISFDWQGESVGFFRFSPAMAASLGERTQAYVDDGRKNEPYEEAIRDLLLAFPQQFGWEDISGLPWIEIDFPDDVRRAREEVLEQLTASVN